MKKYLLLLSFSLFGCSTTSIPIHKSKNVIDSKQLEYRPIKGKSQATITVLRDRGFFGSACDTDVLVNGKTVGHIGTGEHIQLYVELGEYILGVKPRSWCAGGLVETEVKIDNYVEKRYRIGIYNGGSMHLQRASE